MDLEPAAAVPATHRCVPMTLERDGPPRLCDVGRDVGDRHGRGMLAERRPVVRRPAAAYGALR